MLFSGTITFRPSYRRVALRLLPEPLHSMKGSNPMSQTHQATGTVGPLPQITALFDPAGRVLISAIFLISGITKITGFSGTQQYMEAVGVPGMLLPLVIALEVGGAVAVILGVYARVASFLLAGFCLLSAVLFHNQLGDQTQFIMFMKNLAITGGFLFIAARGPGAYSLGNPNR
jgi:putative oxidoreductase